NVRRAGRHATPRGRGPGRGGATARRKKPPGGERRGEAAAPGAPAPAPRFTALRLPLARALEKPESEEGKLLGVLLLTDGQHNWGAPPNKKAADLGKAKVPIFPLALGGPAKYAAPPDVAVVEVKAPATGFKEVDANVEARLKVTGLPEQELIVELQRQGQPVDEEHVKHLKHDGTNREHTVRFQVRMDQVGAQVLTVTARPVDREVTKANN